MVVVVPCPHDSKSPSSATSSASASRCSRCRRSPSARSRTASTALHEGNRQQAYAVILRDQYIDEKEKEIDRLCLEFLVRQQPVGLHLRLAYSTIKINLELERVGDYAESIARQILRLSSLPSPPARCASGSSRWPTSRSRCCTTSIEAFVQPGPDARAAASILSEPAVDALLGKLNAELVEALRAQTILPEMAEPLVTIGRRFERVADQARNVCMETLYMCTGEYAKHPGAETFRVLFVGEHNACRSQMAEAIAQSLGQPKFIFSSAGLDPRAIDPRTLAFMREKGFDIGRMAPKAIDQVPNLDHYQVIVGVAQEAQQAFPRSPRKMVYVDWSIDDPSRRPGLGRRGPRGLRGHLPIPVQPRARPRRAPCWASASSRPTIEPAGDPHDPSPSLDVLRLLLVGLARRGPRRRVRRRRRPAAAKPAKTVIQNKGSDTMVNVAQVVGRGVQEGRARRRGRGLGRRLGRRIAALIKGTVDIANASRDIKPEEIEQAKKNTGKEPVEFMVGYDALAVYVHKDNPLDRDHARAARANLRRGRQGDALVGARREDPRRQRRHDRARQPPVELRHLRVLPRARARQQGLQARLARPERLQGSRRAGGHDADRDRLQRHGLRDAGGEDAEGRAEGQGRARACAPTVAAVTTRRYPLARSLHVYTLGEPQGAVKAVHRLDPVRRRARRWSRTAATCRCRPTQRAKP